MAGEMDTRTQVQVPEDFQHVLSEVPGAQTGWDMLSDSQKRDYIARLDGAADPADRERIVDESVQELVQQLDGRPPHVSG